MPGVAKCSWVFRAQIDIDVDRLDDGFQAELVFEGIDTFGTVKLVSHRVSALILEWAPHSRRRQPFQDLAGSRR